MTARFHALAVLALGVAFIACSKRDEAGAPAALGARGAEPKAPQGLVAELSVPDPRGSWKALHALGGSRVESLPSNFELALFSLLDLSPRIAGFVRPETPLLGVVMAPSGAAPVGVFGVRTTHGSELLLELTRKENGYRAERDGTAVTVLVGPTSDPVLAIVDDWLLVSRDAATLRAAGEYLVRGLGARRLPDAPLTLRVSHDALLGPIAAGVKSRWAALRGELEAQAREARSALGRPADFADPEAMLGYGDAAIQALDAMLRSSEQLTFSLRPADDRLELTVSIAPEPNGDLARSIAALEVGPLTPLLELPRSTATALLSRSSQAELALSAEKPADGLRSILGDRLAEKDAAPLASALRSIHRGRGSLTLVGFFGAREPKLFLRQETRDPKELEQGAKGLFALARVPALAEPLEPMLGKIQVRDPIRIDGIEGPVLRVGVGRFGRRGRPAELLLKVRGDGAVAVLAENAREGLVELLSDSEELGAAPGVAKLVANRAPAALALFTDLRMFNYARPRGAFETEPGPAPALALLGKRGSDAVVEVALSVPACRALLALVGTP